MREYWEPAVRARHGFIHRQRPDVGQLIAYDRTPFRVLEVNDVEPWDWTDEDRDVWQRDGMPDPWRDRPHYVVLERVVDGRRSHGKIGPRVYGWWKPLPEHYAICVMCGELAPCREFTAAGQAEREMQRVELLLQVLPGCCWSCQEPITSRQATITFTGPNLLLPTAAADPSFHLRRACVTVAARYEELWVQADPTRARTALTLKCTGTLVFHHDGSSECFGAVDSTCPDPRAAHRVYTACFAQSHGCPRDCPREGHPGAGFGRRRRSPRRR